MSVSLTTRIGRSGLPVVAILALSAQAAPPADLPMPEQAIPNTLSNLVSLAAGDIDGDGDLDFAAASHEDGRIAWYEKYNTTPPTFGEHVLATAADQAFSVCSRKRCPDRRRRRTTGTTHVYYLELTLDGTVDDPANLIPIGASPPGDTNDDGAVDVNDLNNIILDWGTDGSAHGGDIAGAMPGSPPDGIVDVNDLNAVIVNWGPA